MSNEYMDWKNEEIADLNYCLNHMYDALGNIFNILYDNDNQYNDDNLKYIANVLNNVDDSLVNGNRENISCLNSLVNQEYHALKKVINTVKDTKLYNSINETLTNVEYLRGDTLE